MNKNDIMTIELEDAAKETSQDQTTFIIGEKIFVRTVTHHLTGRIKAITQCFGTGFLLLEDAAWIASDGRFTQAMEDGALDEIEPVTCPVRLNVDSIIDVYVWRHPLPRAQK